MNTGGQTRPTSAWEQNVTSWRGTGRDMHGASTAARCIAFWRMCIYLSWRFLSQQIFPYRSRSLHHLFVPSAFKLIPGRFLFLILTPTLSLHCLFLPSSLQGSRRDWHFSHSRGVGMCSRLGPRWAHTGWVWPGASTADLLTFNVLLWGFPFTSPV